MDETIEEKVEIAEEVIETPSSSTEEVDYKALADAEKARADAAEALIVKNKNIAKRQDIQSEEAKPLTRAEVLELIKTKETDDSSAETKALDDANKRVKEIQAKNAELARALKSKDGVSSDSATTQFDGATGGEPKLPDNSPLKAYKYMGNGIYSKKLPGDKTLFKNIKPVPGQPHTWVE
jgi:hypothetical protein